MGTSFLSQTVSRTTAGASVVFFFSSRRRHTRLQGDWSSDVCSSDLARHAGREPGQDGPLRAQLHGGCGQRQRRLRGLCACREERQLPRRQQARLVVRQAARSVFPLSASRSPVFPCKSFIPSPTCAPSCRARAAPPSCPPWAICTTATCPWCAPRASTATLPWPASS